MLDYKVLYAVPPSSNNRHSNALIGNIKKLHGMYSNGKYGSILQTASALFLNVFFLTANVGKFVVNGGS